MIIEEMKAKGFKRYTRVIEKLIVTNCPFCGEKYNFGDVKTT